MITVLYRTLNPTPVALPVAHVAEQKLPHAVSSSLNQSLVQSQHSPSPSLQDLEHVSTNVGQERIHLSQRAIKVKRCRRP